MPLHSKPTHCTDWEWAAAPRDSWASTAVEGDTDGQRRELQLTAAEDVCI
jgi:hypothetical protein